MGKTDSTTSIPANKDEMLVEILVECFRNYDIKSFVWWQLKEHIEDDVNLQRGLKYVVADTVEFLRKQGRLEDFVLRVYALHSGDGRFTGYVNSLPGDLPARAYHAAGFATQLHKQNDIASFDLVTTLQQSLHLLPADQPVVGIAVACPIEPFTTSYCKRLKENLALNGAVQLREVISLDPLRNDDAGVLLKMKRLKGTLAQMHVIAPLVVDPSMASACERVWRELTAYYNDTSSNRLVVPMFSSSRATFPAGIPVISAPEFTEDEIKHWIDQLRCNNNLPHALMHKWEQTCLHLCRVAGCISVLRVYDHLEFFAQNFPIPPTEDGMMQLMADWSSSYATA